MQSKTVPLQFNGVVCIRQHVPIYLAWETVQPDKWNVVDYQIKVDWYDIWISTKQDSSNTYNELILGKSIIFSLMVSIFVIFNTYGYQYQYVLK